MFTSLYFDSPYGLLQTNSQLSKIYHKNIYLTTARLGKYPPLFTSTSVNNFSMLRPIKGCLETTCISTVEVCDSSAVGQTRL